MFKADVLKRFYEAEVETGKITIRNIGIYAVRDFMKSNQGQPIDVLSIRSGRLARAVMGQRTDIGGSMVGEGEDTVSILGGSVEIRKSVRVPYAEKDEYGGDFPYKSANQRKAMFARLKEMGWYDKNYVKQGAKGQISFKPRPYIRPAKTHAASEIKDIFIREILKRFNDNQVRVIE